MTPFPTEIVAGASASLRTGTDSNGLVSIAFLLVIVILAFIAIELANNSPYQK